MASTIKIKRSNTGGNVPDPDTNPPQIVEGELALNTRDGILYSHGGNDNDAVFEIGANNTSISVNGSSTILSNNVITCLTPEDDAHTIYATAQSGSSYTIDGGTFPSSSSSRVHIADGAAGTNEEDYHAIRIGTNTGHNSTDVTSLLTQYDVGDTLIMKRVDDPKVMYYGIISKSDYHANASVYSFLFKPDGRRTFQSCTQSDIANATMQIAFRKNFSGRMSHLNLSGYKEIRSASEADAVHDSFFNGVRDETKYKLILDDTNGYFRRYIQTAADGSYQFNSIGIDQVNAGNITNSSSYKATVFEVGRTTQGWVFRTRAHGEGTNSNHAASIAGDGKMTISYGLRVGHGATDTSSFSSLYRCQVGGSFYASSNIVAYSDKRAKENIKPITGALDKVLKMQGVYYNMKESHTHDGEDSARRRVGVLAQDIQKILPEVVSYCEDQDKYAVDYGNITSILIEAIKDQQEIINSLDSRLKELESN